MQPAAAAAAKVTASDLIGSIELSDLNQRGIK